MIILVLMVLLLLAAVGTGPWWNHSHQWGYAPSGALSLILVVFLVLYLLGHRF